MSLRVVLFKTLSVCGPEDFVCADRMDFAAHNPSTYTGPLTDQGAACAASHLSRSA
jgi:cutinase